MFEFGGHSPDGYLAALLARVLPEVSFPAGAGEERINYFPPVSVYGLLGISSFVIEDFFIFIS